MYCTSSANFSIPDAMSTLAAVEVLMEDRWIVVHPHCTSRYDVNDRRPLQAFNEIDPPSA